LKKKNRTGKRKKSIAVVKDKLDKIVTGLKNIRQHYRSIAKLSARQQEIINAKRKLYCKY
jgi:hypothetical protein